MKSSKIFKPLLYVGIGAGAFLAADKFDLIDKSTKIINDVVEYAVDITTTDLKEATEDYLTQIREEPNKILYEKDLIQANKEISTYLSNESKTELIEYNYNMLPDSLKAKSAYAAVENLNDSLSLIVLKESIKNQPYNSKMSILGHSIKETMSETSQNSKEGIKTFFQDVEEFFKNAYKNIKEVI